MRARHIGQRGPSRRDTMRPHGPQTQLMHPRLQEQPPLAAEASRLVLPGPQVDASRRTPPGLEADLETRAEASLPKPRRWTVDFQMKS